MTITISQMTFDEIAPIIHYIKQARMRVNDTDTTVWFGAKDGEELVGVAAYSIFKQTAVYKTSFVKKEYRNKGIYTRLFEVRDEYVSKLNIKKIRAYCTSYSIKHLLKHGFKEIEKRGKITVVEKEVNQQPTVEKINFSTFCEVIEGTVVAGRGDFTIQHITDLSKYVKKPNTVLFVYREKLQNMNLYSLLKHKPCAIVYEKGTDPPVILSDITYIMVENMKKSYWSFVNYYRGLFDIPVFAITGTCGKTTTKEMIAHILKGKYRVQSTKASSNSYYYNLNYLCGITDQTDVAVFETPVGGPSLVEYHCKYFKPTIGMITNIGIDHILHCGTLERYIKGKGKILNGLNFQGTLLINADDEKTKEISLEPYKGNVVSFGIYSQADYEAKNIQYADNGMNFTLVHEGLEYEMFVPGYGEHQVYNAISAIAAVHQIEFPIEEAGNRLQTFTNVRAHLEIYNGCNGALVYDDSWNANPTSIEAALKAFNDTIGDDKQKIAVIGTMSLLGDEANIIHWEVGENIARHGVDTLITFGDFSKEIAAGAMSLNFKNVITCRDVNEVEQVLMPLLNECTAVLLKASMYDKSVSSLIKKLKNSITS